MKMFSKARKSLIVLLTTFSFATPTTYASPTCTVSISGPYASFSQARDAARLARGSSDINCWYKDSVSNSLGLDVCGYSESFNRATGESYKTGVLRTNCDSFNYDSPYYKDTDWTYIDFTSLDGCPTGSEPNLGAGGLCECIEGQFNSETLACEELQCHPPTSYNESTGLCEKECPIDKPWSDTARDCVAPPEPEGCSHLVGNPINFLSGHKLMKETVLEAKHGSLLSFSWLYNSFGNHIKSGAGYSIGAGVAGVTSLHSEPPIQGNQPLITLPLSPKPTEAYTGHATQHWRHNHSYFLAHYVMPDGLTERLIAYRPNGNDIRFIEEDGIFVAQANRDWRITKELNDDSIQIGWRLAVGNLTEHYDSAGRILRIEDISGHSLTYTYHVDGTQQKSITDENGSTLSLNYADGQLAEVIQNQNTSYQFEYYADGMLKSITFPGNDSPKKTYLYEDPRFPGALTSVIDESGNMYSNYTYDSQGRAVRTEYSYGTNSVNVDYIDNNTRRITNALGVLPRFHGRF